MITILENSIIFDGTNEALIEGASVVVEDGYIKDVSPGSTSIDNAHRVNCGGRMLMPGLIDAHFHAYTPSFDIPGNDSMPVALMTSHARKSLEDCLKRGFTTVRDAAGGDIGLSLSIEQGLIQGPRFFFSGKAISQTGGHGDMRPGDKVELCSCGSYSGSISQVADGTNEMRKAVREELRKGATQIKLFVSGGIISPTDPLEMPQFTEEEIRTAVYEASTRNTYVMAHCHTDDGARRCVEYGVRSIEHGTFIKADTARFIAERGAYVVPTLTVIDVLRKHSRELGIPPMSLNKIEGVYDQMLSAVETCTKAGVKLGLGADLLDHRYHPLQGAELALRGEVNTPIQVLRSATSINAELLQQSGNLGCISPGAHADLLVLNGNPFKDLTLFQDAERNIPVVMKGGRFIRNVLPSDVI